MVLDRGRHNFIVLLDHFLQKKKEKRKEKSDAWPKVRWWFGHFMWKNCCHFAKLQVLRNSAGTDWSCIHYWKTAYSWRDYSEAVSKEVTLLWSRTRRIQAAATRCCCRRVLDHWTTTGCWGSCGSAGLPCYMRWPGGSPYPASSCRNKRYIRVNVRQNEPREGDAWRVNIMLLITRLLR